MPDERNENQIIRVDARNCFVESLNDGFQIGRVHLCFATYDVNLPSGSRQTNRVHIYLSVGEFIELCRKMECGEMRFLLETKKQSGDYTPIYNYMGGTSAEKLAQYGRPRPDGMSLSRTAQLTIGKKADFLFSASNGPGQQDQKGLIVPRFGKNPENHVSVSMSFDLLSQFLLMTKLHYMAWLSAQYMLRQNEADSEYSLEEPAESYDMNGYNDYGEPPAWG